MEHWLEHDVMARRSSLKFHPGCKANNEDVSSWILTLGLDSTRNDECEEGGNRLMGSGEHTRHPHRSTAERESHETGTGASPFRSMNGALIKRYSEKHLH